MKNVFTVATADQKALFDHEIKGQLSDGQWENSRPLNHYKVWCDAEVVVGEIPGRNFYAAKDNYNLTNAEFLACIDNRMISNVKLIRTFGEQYFNLLKYLFDINGNFTNIPDWIQNSTNEYYATVRNNLSTLISQLGGITEIKNRFDAQNYTRKNLIADLKELKTAMRTMHHNI